MTPPAGDRAPTSNPSRVTQTGGGVLARPGVVTATLAVDASGRIAEADWQGWLGSAVPPDRLGDLVHPADRSALTALVLAAVANATPTRRMLHVRVGGVFAPALVQIDDRLPAGGLLQVRMFALTTAGPDLEALAELAFWDPLTSLANRVLFADHLRAELQRGARSGRRTAVLVGDVNGLKRVNDELGHRAGDALLAEVGSRLAAACRPSDTPARLSGDEFAVVCPEVDSEHDARELATRLRTAVGGTMLLDGRSVEVRVAFGWAVSVDGDETDGGADLVHRADICMYGAKRFLPASEARSGW